MLTSSPGQTQVMKSKSEERPITLTEEQFLMTESSLRSSKDNSEEFDTQSEQSSSSGSSLNALRPVTRGCIDVANMEHVVEEDDKPVSPK